MTLSAQLTVSLGDIVTEGIADGYTLSLEPGSVPCAEADLRITPATESGGSAGFFTSAGTLEVLERRVETLDRYLVLAGESSIALGAAGTVTLIEPLGSASSPSGEAISPVFSAADGLLLASEACHAVVHVQIESEYRRLRWSQAEGSEIGVPDHVLIAYFEAGIRPATLLLQVDAERCSGGEMTEAGRVVSSYLVDSDGPHEMPAGWPANTRGTDGTVFVQEDCWELLRTHAILSLSGESLYRQTFTAATYAPFPLHPPNGYVLRTARSTDAEVQARIDAVDWPAAMVALEPSYPGIVHG